MVGSTVKALKTVTFNAYGTKQINGFNPKYPENVINYGNEKDLVFTKRLDDQVGKTLVIKSKAFAMPHPTAYHGVENMGDIGEAVEYKSKKASYTPANPGSMLLRPAKRLEARLQMEWGQSAAKKQEARSKFEETKSFKGYVNKVSKNERIYTEEEIERFSRQEKARYHSAIEYQRKEIGIPTKSQAQRAVSKGGMVYVSAYVRGDGIQVGSYYRSRPHG